MVRAVRRAATSPRTAEGCLDERIGRTEVSGATGRHGSTGAHVARRLREEGRPVRTLARTLRERTDVLAELGAEVVIGDLHDRRGLVAAFT
jgi:uncharacterized protein YbjT (DUF2867 family)